jgi:8-amino-3,8-dideoxy-alpha-D-manno-octulosonate transaminase
MPGFELIGQEERDAVNKIFDEGGGILFAHGFDGMRNGMFNVRSFETEFAEKVGAKFAQAVSSGTAGLKVALKAAGVSQGDEVITQAFNFISDVEVIVDCGAKPMIANVDETLNMCATDLESLISEKTKAIIVVHMLGVSANMNAIMEVARKHNITVIEDNCESLGATWDGAHLGTLADIGVYSFDMGKVITCGEGGMVVSNNEKYFKYACEYHDHGHENNKALPRGRDSRSIPGFNYRMTEMQGAVGRAQLKKLDYLVSENRKRYGIYEEMLGHLECRKVMDQCEPLGDTFMFKITDPGKHQKVVEYLISEGGGTKNVPDAVEWHCAGYWDHCLDSEQHARAKVTKDILSQYIALPIMVKRELSQYQETAKRILEILES